MEQIEKRLQLIESRLAAIENRSNTAKDSNTAKESSASIAIGQKPELSIIHSQPEAAAKSERQENWLGIVAIICFILAAGFIIKLSIESGWLTPVRQLGLAAVFGLALIGCGFALMRSDREYASLLPGAGIVVLYLTVFAAHRYYALIPFEVAIAVTTLVSGLCIWLYTEIKHEVYAISAASGAYLSPLVLGFNTEAVFSLYYFFLCSIAFASISVGVKSRTLTLVSAYLAILMSAAVGFDIKQDVLVAALLAVNFFIFSLGAYLFSVKNRLPLLEHEAWSLFPVLLAFYAAEYYFIDRIQPGLAPWISLTFAAVLIGLYLSAKKYFSANLGSQSLIMAFTTIVCFHSIYLELLPANIRPWLFVLIMAAVAFGPFGSFAETWRNAFIIPLLAVFIVLAVEYVTILFYLFDGGDSSWLLVAFAAFTSIWAVIVTKRHSFPEPNRFSYCLLGLAHLMAVMGLYRLTAGTGSLAVSASWLLYAVCVMIFAFNRKDEIMARSALFVLAFAGGKALLYDAASAPTAVRILCLMITGMVLYGSGLLMRKISVWKAVSTK